MGSPRSSCSTVSEDAITPASAPRLLVNGVEQGHFIEHVSHHIASSRATHATDVFRSVSGLAMSVPGGCAVVIAPQKAYTHAVNTNSLQLQSTDGGYMTRQLRGLHESSDKF